MSDSLISKIWNYCHTLRDDGLSYSEYLEQLTFMLFLKMADEYAGPPYFRDTHIPKDYNWQSLVKDNISGAALENQYVSILRNLGKEKGMIGQIFA